MALLDQRAGMVRPHRRAPNTADSPRKQRPLWLQPVKLVGLLVDAFISWCRHHLRAQVSSLSYVRKEFGQFVPACVGLGLILSLPLLLYMLALNIHYLGGYWRLGSGISAYLQPNGEEQAELDLVSRIRAMPEVGEVVYHSRTQALEEFRSWSGLSQLLDGLSRNPLPSAVEVYHSDANPGRKEIELLRLTLDAMPEISVARADMNWLTEYRQLGDLLWRTLFAAAVVVLGSTLFVIAFSVRMMIMSRREEIRVTKLMGANFAYVARPFMYLGSCYGALGTLVACLFVALCGLWLDQPIAQLVDMYEGSFQLQGLGFQLSFLLIVVGAIVGAVGAWIGVRSQLSNFNEALKIHR